MKRYTFLLIIVFTFLATSTLHAQEWSEEQKDIWQVVENLWAMWKTGNSDTTLQFFYKNDLFKRNEEMSLFNSEDDFADTLKEKNRSKRERNYSIEPLRILNYGNIAIVEYKYSASLKIENKGVVTGYKSKSKITWLFTKENGKWIFQKCI